MYAPLRYLSSITMLGLGYFLAGQIGLAMNPAEHWHASGAIWPPAGVALAALLRFGIGLWPGIVLGAAALGWGETQLGPVVVTALGGVTMAVTGAWLLRRSARFHPQLQRLEHLLVLALYGGIIAGLVEAGMVSLGESLVATDHALPLTHILYLWLGNANGVLLVAPLLLLWGTKDSLWRVPHPLLETLAAFALLILATDIGFSVIDWSGDQALPLAFAPVPFLVWIALRLPLQATAAAVMITMLIAGLSTINGHGPFATFPPFERELLLWGFGVAVGLTTMLLAIAIANRHRLVERLRDLEQTVERIGAARGLDELLAIVRSAARRLTGADGATIVLREGDTCRYADEEAIEPLWPGQQHPLTGCISGWAMLHNQPAAIEDVYADPRIPHDAYRQTFVKSLTIVPIGSGEPRAAIGCYWAVPHRASTEELMLQQALANATAVGLESIDLYHRLNSARGAAEAIAANLRLSETFKDKVLTRSLNGLCLFDLKTRLFEYINPQYTRLTGYTLEDLNAMNHEQFMALFHPHDRNAIVRHQQALTEGGDQDAFEIEYRFRRADGRWVWLLSHDSVLERDPDSSVRRILGTFIDITARKEAQLQQRLREVAIASAQQRIVVAEVATNVAHELNQPLTAVTNYCEAALSLTQNTDNRSRALLRDALRQACEEAQRAGTVARYLGVMVERRKHNPIPVALNTLIDNTLSVIKPEADHEGVSIVQIPGAGDVRITVDQSQLEQVLLALVHNSLEAMRRAASPVREIVVCTRRVNHCVEVTVEDTGPGLAMSPGNEVFDPWDPSRHHGAGINLSACRSIVEAHGGHLLADVGTRGGAVLRCTLPLAPTEEPVTSP